MLESRLCQFYAIFIIVPRTYLIKYFATFSCFVILVIKPRDLKETA